MLTRMNTFIKRSLENRWTNEHLQIWNYFTNNIKEQNSIAQSIKTTRMTTFIKAKIKKSDEQTNIDK